MVTPLRYNEQKRRLIAAGFERPMYLVEGSLSEQDLMSSATLEQAVTSTQVRGTRSSRLRTTFTKTHVTSEPANDACAYS